MSVRVIMGQYRSSVPEDVAKVTREIEALLDKGYEILTSSVSPGEGDKIALFVVLETPDWIDYDGGDVDDAD